MEILHIEYNGDIYPCPYLQLSLGNILKDNIFDIWLNHPILQNLRTKEKYTKCSHCVYWGDM
jgi:radical SAM protein with 4Fe4S-binding SPASM domain